MTMVQHVVAEKLDWRNGSLLMDIARNWIADGL